MTTNLPCIAFVKNISGPIAPGLFKFLPNKFEKQFEQKVRGRIMGRVVELTQSLANLLATILQFYYY